MLRGRKIGRVVALLIVGVTAWQCALRPLLRSVPEGSSLFLHRGIFSETRLELPGFDLATDGVHEWDVRFVDFPSDWPFISLVVSQEDGPLAHWKLPVRVEVEVRDWRGRLEFAHAGWLQDKWWNGFEHEVGERWQGAETGGVIYWPPQWDSQYGTKESEEYSVPGYGGKIAEQLSASFTVRVKVEVDADADLALLGGVRARVRIERGSK